MKATETLIVFPDLPEYLDRRLDMVETQQRVRTAVRWLEDIKATLLTKLQERRRRDQAMRTAPGPRPCRMASQGCKGSHHLGVCENFKQKPAAWKVDQLNK